MHHLGNEVGEHIVRRQCVGSEIDIPAVYMQMHGAVTCVGTHTWQSCRYLLGVPITGYDLTIGKEHVDFAEAKLQQRLFQSKLEPTDIDQLAVVAMAGVAAEAMNFEEVWHRITLPHASRRRMQWRQS
jgi:hypothetical protein